MEVVIGARSEPLDLTQARLLKRAQRGEQAAGQALWERQVDALWSIAVALVDEDEAIEVIREVRGAFLSRLRGLPLGQGWRDQALGILWHALLHRLEPMDLAGILSSDAMARELPALGSRAPRGDARARVAQAIEDAPVELRMIYLFATLGAQDAAAISGYSGYSDHDVRQARSAMAWRLVRTLRSGARSSDMSENGGGAT